MEIGSKPENKKSIQKIKKLLENKSKSKKKMM